jgi:hypothetical protein
MAVQKYPGLPGAHPNHEGGQVTLGAGTLVADSRQVPGFEPAVDEVYGRARHPGGVRPEAYKPPREGEYLGAV